MKYPLPDDRPMTNFIWRYTPRFDERVNRVVRLASFCALFFAVCLLVLSISAQRQVPYLFNCDVRHWYWWAIPGGWLRQLADFSDRRNFVNPLLAQGTDFATANSAWEAREQAKPLFARVCG
jgi:hypothetical protein